jgi:type IV pilus assembly protein PilQ
MRLDNVPWDQALEMVLRPNDLTYQIENDVLWVVPKATLVDMEIKERNRKSALLSQKRVQGIFEPKILEYMIIKHRKAEDIFRMLVGDPTAVPPLPGVLDVEVGEAKEKEKGEEEEGKETKIVTMDIYLTYDAGTNMIIVNGVRSKVEKVKELIAKLDVPEKQVMIEARVVEAETGFTRDLGIQWRSLDGENPGFEREWYNTGSNSWGGGEFSTNAPSGWKPTIGLALGWLTDGGLGTLALDASLALGESENKIHIISAPKVLTLNGQEAVIKRGEVAYKEIRTLDTIDVREMTAALSLSVTPTVSADNSHVTLLVKVTDDRLIPGTSDNPYPGKREKVIETKLMVRTGETIVIGGIYYESKSTVEDGVPWLKDVPILGWLFKAERKETTKVELLIFLTPTVVTTPEVDMAKKGQT